MAGKAWRRLMWSLSNERGTTVFDAVFRRRLARRYDRGHQRAMQDQRYRELEGLIGTLDGGLLLKSPKDVDLWEEQTEIFDRINPPPWYLRAKWRRDGNLQ